MRFRIGIHGGDVIVVGTDLYADAVNIAARVRTLDEGNALLAAFIACADRPWGADTRGAGQRILSHRIGDRAEAQLPP